MRLAHSIAQKTVRLGVLFLFAVSALFLSHSAAAQNASTIGNGIISTFAGGGSASGDDVTNLSYSFSSVTATATDANGNVYILDQSAGQVLLAYVGGPVPPLLSYRVNNPPAPYPAATAVAGNIYVVAGISASYATQIGIDNVCNDQQVNPGPCGDGASALLGTMDTPADIAVDSSGNLYIADEVSQAIRKVSASNGFISTIVGDPMHAATGYSGENVTATGSLLNYPSAVAVDSAGNLFISDGSNFIIRKVTASTNKMTTVAGTVPSGGTPVECTTGPCGDGGQATAATIDYAAAVTVAANGDLYITDQAADTVRKVTAATGVISTVAGNYNPFPDSCVTAPCGDGGSATSAELNTPYYAALDSVGNVLIADYSDNALRYTSHTTGEIQDAVGTTSLTGGYTGDTGQAIHATLNTPQQFAFDPAGNLYIADSGNVVVRKVAAPTSLTPQTITFGPLPTVNYGASPFTLGATASSGLAVTYTVTGPATLSGADLRITGAGTVAVTANQAGNATYNPATPVTQSFTVNKADLTVTATNLSRVFGAGNPVLTYSTSGLVNGDTISVITGSPVLSTTAVATSPIGTYPITITTGTLSAANYAFILVNGTLTVTGSTAQTITFAALPNITYGSAQSTVPLSATASSGLPVTFSVSGPANLQGSTLTANGAGLVTVTASQEGNSQYAAAQAVRTFTVNPAPLTVSAVNATRVYGQPNPAFSFTATGFVGGDTIAVLTGGPVFSTTANATSAPGTYPITLVQGTLFSPNYSFVFVSGLLTVTQATQSITFPPIPALTGNQGTTYTLQATASSGLAVQYTATGAASIIAGGTLLINGPGAASVTATQPGNADYAAATPLTQTFNIGLVPLNVVATSFSRPFGGNNPVFTYGFFSGNAAATLVSGSVTGLPVLTSPANQQSPTGTYPILIGPGSLTSPIYDFTFVYGTLTVTPPATYTLTVNPNAVTVPVGQSRQVTITLTPINLYQGSVSIGCSGLPSGVTCTSSPASLVADGTGNIVQSTLTISAGQTVASAQTGPSTSFLAGIFWLPSLVGGGLLLFYRRKLRSHSSAYFLSLLLLALVSATALTACGGGSSNGTSVQKGTSQVMVTGSGSDTAGSANTAQSVALTVVIQ